MQLVSRAVGAVEVVTVSGRVDHAGAPQFEAELAPVLERAGAVLLDFSAVDYVSSVGLRALMLAARKMASRGGRIAITGLQPLVREVFDISRFHLVMKVAESVEAGVAELGGGA